MITATIDRPPTGEAWLDGPVELRVAVMLFEFAWNKRARTNDGELTDEDIDKLRHFVDRGFAKAMADFSDSGVVFDFMIFVPLFFILWIFEEFFKFFVGVDDHGAEFEHFEGLTMAADASLRINNPVEITGAKIS